MRTAGIRKIYAALFGEYDLLAMILTGILAFSFFYFVYDKKHRNWKLYKRIMGEKAEKSNDYLGGPEKPSSSIFPDVSPDDEPKE